MRIALFLLFLASAAFADINYTYDAAGRLIKADYGNGTSITYTYDKAGNLTGRTTATSSGPVITSVRTAFGGPEIAQNTWVQINGTNLVPANTPASGVLWSSAPSFATGQLPTQIGTISVTVNNNPAFIYFYCSAATDSACSTDQINILTPLDNTTGTVQVVVTNGSTVSSPFAVTMNKVAPAFLLFPGGYIAARHLDFSLLGATTLYPGSSTPAAPGETVLLYGSGFGLPTNALNNGSVSQSGSLPALPSCRVGANPAAVVGAALAGPGLYQINLTVPQNTPNGDNAVVCTYGGASTPSGDLITVQK